MVLELRRMEGPMYIFIRKFTKVRSVADAARRAKSGIGQILIPRLIDQNSCAHWRNPMDMMLQGRSTSVFQA
jgi:hypothetical protein